MSLNRPRLTLLAIVLLFAAPVVIAVLMHSRWWNYQPHSTTNLGQLVTPPRPVELASLEMDTANQGPLGRWTILYPVTLPCAADCRKRIENLRQIHLAAGRHRDELAIVLLLPEPARISDGLPLRDIYAGFSLATDDSGALPGLLASIASGGADTGGLQPGQVFLLDPAGNIMLYYGAGYDPNHINKDLKRLLKWSGQDG